jgi:arylsulfatase A-like enzyme
MTFGTGECEAQQVEQTPNIDRISQEGISFTNAYCQSPMCAASRNSLLTGIYPHTSGAYGFQKRKELASLKDVVTLPEHF